MTTRMPNEPQKPTPPPSIDKPALKLVDKHYWALAGAFLIILAIMVAIPAASVTHYRVLCETDKASIVVETPYKPNLDYGTITMPDKTTYIVPGNTVCKAEEIDKNKEEQKK